MSAQDAPIELYFFPTPNGLKISIMLEELGVPYNVNIINFYKGEQLTPEFLAISPNNKIPAIVDPNGPDGKPISIFESGAILKYLAEKFDKFYPKDKRKQVEVDQWLFWQMAGFGPMLGQAHHFNVFAKEKYPYAIKRYSDEAKRLYGVLNKQLEGKDYICGEYSIADIASIGWARVNEKQGVDINEYMNVKNWIERMKSRPAVARAFLLGDKETKKLELENAKK